jgi:hypothetical protein
VERRRSMIVVVAAEQFLKHLVINYGKHKVKYLQVVVVHGIRYHHHKPANY